jgi:ankyrin repeat protein
MTFLLDNPILALGVITLILGIIYYIKASAQQNRARIKKILETDLGSCKTPSDLEKLIKQKNKYSKDGIATIALTKAIIDYIEDKKFKKYLKILIKSGAELNQNVHVHDVSPLIYAILNHHDKPAKILTDQGSDINTPNSNDVYLIGIAAANGQIDAIDYALNHNCSIEIADANQNSPLLYALSNGQLETAQYLINKNTNLDATNSSKDTLLGLLIQKSQIESVQFLLKAGSNPDLLNAAGESPVQQAINSQQLNILSALLDSNARVEINDSYSTMDTDNYNIVKLIFSKISFDQNLGDYLYTATISQQLHTMEALLELGADPDYVQKDFITPIIIAAMSGVQATFDLLLPNSTLSPFTKLINHISLSDGNVSLNLKSLKLSEVGGELIFTKDTHSASLHWEISTREVERYLGLVDVRLKENKDDTYSVLFYNGSNLGLLAKSLTVRGSETNFVQTVNTQSSKNIVFKNIPGAKLADWDEQQGYIEDILGVPVEIEQYNNDHDLFPDLGRDKLIIIKESNLSAIPASLGLSGEFVKETKNKGVKEIHFMNVSDSNSWQVKSESISNLIKRKIQVIVEGSRVILRDSIEASIPSLLDWDDTKDTPILLHTVEHNGNTDYFYSYSHDRDLNTWKEASRKVSFKTLFNQPDKVYKLNMYDRSNETIYDPSFSTEQMIVLHEFAAIPTKEDLMNFNADTVLKDKQMFWGYGTGSSKYYTSIADLPHMMIIGASGSGKSNFINGLILSLLNNIDDIQKMYLVDLKSGIEFNRYKDLNPSKINVFSKGTSPSKFLAALQEVEAQMYLREEYMVENNIIKLNDDPIFIIIDEYAQIQLMHARGEEMMAKDEIVDTLIRIGTRARSANIKLIVQTQDPRAVEDELKVHLMSRALLKTSKENDMAFTLQNEDLAIEMGIKHTLFDKGRFVFEDYNDGDTKLHELQFPYIDPQKGLHNNFDMSNHNSSGINLDKYTAHVAREYPYLAKTQILIGADEAIEAKSEIIPGPKPESTSSVGKPFDFNALLSDDNGQDGSEDNSFLDTEDEDNLKEINRMQSESLDILKELLEE